MSRSDRLGRKVAKLGRDGDVGRDGERHHGPDAEGLLSRLLETIDETILPRRLTITGGAGRSLTIHVRNGRMTRIVAAAGDAGAAQPWIDRDLSDVADAALAALRPTFDHLAGDAATLSVASEPLDHHPPAQEIGVAATRLAETWGVPIDGPAEPDPARALARLREAVASHARAWVVLAPDGTAERGGDSGLAARLAALPAPEPAAPREALVLGLSGGSRILAARHDGHRLICALSDEGVAVAIRTWQRINL